MDLDEAAQALREFVAVVRALRAPGTGCPWDLEQDHRSLRPYLVEETYEVIDAIDRDDDPALREELGDLLLQVVLHAQVAEDRRAFSIADVARGITEKMVRRHPHVFGTTAVSGSAEVAANWDRIKAAEAEERGGTPADALRHVPGALPALLRAQRLAEKADRVRPDSRSLTEILGEVRAGLAGLEEAARSAEPRGRLEERFGAALFGLCRLAGRLGVSAEDSLRDTCRDFADDLPGHKQ